MANQPTGNAVVAGAGFHHVAIRTSDWDRCKRFYQEGMGFTPAVGWGEAPRRAMMLDTGDGNYLEVFERDPAEVPSEGAILHFAIRCADCRAAVERARSAGAEITKEATDLAVFGEPKIPITIAFFKGPDGEIVELFQNETL